MGFTITTRRQRIPMIDATTLEDRTRPPLEEGWLAPRLRFYQWPSWSPEPDRAGPNERRPTQARLGRR